ncbi:MAG: exodeoxyribonuclease III [Coxiella sp. (in: Bacteria)]|nr:MAG: exodeoxyribonuclease III [Coxiella sp. (in: g-proteobacteria)]
MRVISFNVNGIRAAARKGMFDWLQQQDADVVCLQETKAQMAHLEGEIFRPQGYHCHFVDAEKKGYSGVGIYSKQKPDKVITTLGWDEADNEGRYIQADFGDLSVISIYLPSGSSGEHRQTVKFDFMKRYEKKLKKQIKDGRSYIICGDWNIVHKEIDIKNFKPNQKNSGCLPEERAWLDMLFDKVGFVDAFRVVNKEPSQYTWWSNRGQARANNVGWRIDYQVITPDLADKVKAVSVYKEQWYSDHAPLIVDYQD